MVVEKSHSSGQIQSCHNWLPNKYFSGYSLHTLKKVACWELMLNTAKGTQAHFSNLHQLTNQSNVCIMFNCNQHVILFCNDCTVILILLKYPYCLNEQYYFIHRIKKSKS